MEKAIHEKSVPTCLKENCGGLVKPEIVFFGEQLPKTFFDNKDLPEEADLCIIMGTSLSVHPFAALPQFVQPSAPRVLINQEQVGGIGSRPNDVLILGDCDTGVRKLAEALGWLDELESVWAMTAPEKQKGKKAMEELERKLQKSRDEFLQEEVDQITREVAENLTLNKAQHKWLENHLVEKVSKKQGEEQPAMTEEEREAAREYVTSSVSKESIREAGSLSHVFPWMNKKASL